MRVACNAVSCCAANHSRSQNILTHLQNSFLNHPNASMMQGLTAWTRAEATTAPPNCAITYRAARRTLIFLLQPQQLNTESLSPQNHQRIRVNNAGAEHNMVHAANFREIRRWSMKNGVACHRPKHTTLLKEFYFERTRKGLPPQVLT